MCSSIYTRPNSAHPGALDNLGGFRDLQVLGLGPTRADFVYINMIFFSQTKNSQIFLCLPSVSLDGIPKHSMRVIQAKLFLSSFALELSTIE